MHYVCKGTCRGVSETPGVCQAEDCPKYHEPLEACDCIDGMHSKALDEGEKKEKES